VYLAALRKITYRVITCTLRLRPSGILNEFPSLAAYVARGEARSAYKQAFVAQLAFNTA